MIWRLVDEVPNIWAVKDAAGNPIESAKLIAGAPDGFELYSGDDPLTLAFLAVGAVGTVGVATHWAGREVGDMLASFAKGDHERARQINASLIPSYEYETSDLTPNPIPTKALLRAIGLPAGQARLPLGPAPDGLEERGRALWESLGNEAPVAPTRDR